MNGIDCFTRGFSLIWEPRLRPYVIIPSVLNLLVFVLLVGVSITWFEDWVAIVTGWLPEWLDFLYWLIYAFGVVIVVFALLFLFVTLANLVAAPFNAILAEKVEEHLTGAPVEASLPLVAIIISSVGREVAKVMYLLPRMLGLLVISMIPVINAASPFLWLLFGAWMMALQFCDFAADANQVTFGDLRQRLGARRFQSLLFGLPAYLLVAIPILNIFLLPALVAGGTLFWVQNLKHMAR